MSRHDWEIPKTREERIPEPRIGDNPQRFKVYSGTAMANVSDQAVAIDWRDPVFAKATRTRVLPSGEVERREVLMESPAEVQDSDPAMKLPENLSPEQLRSLADIEEARRAGKITETEYARAAARSSAANERADRYCVMYPSDSSILSSSLPLGCLLRLLDLSEQRRVVREAREALVEHLDRGGALARTPAAGRRYGELLGAHVVGQPA